MTKWTDVEKEFLIPYSDIDRYIIIGGRTTGKTYSAMQYVLRNFIRTGEQFAYVRRLAESLKSLYMNQLFAGNIETGDALKELKKKGYDTINYFRQSFYPAITEGRKTIRDENNPMGYAFSLSTWENSKGPNFPRVSTIIYDEFITRGFYFQEEPTLFDNIISSIFRERGNGKVIMLANTVNKANPYFLEYGIRNIDDMKPGEIRIYKQAGLNYLLAYCRSTEGKASDRFFNKDNSRAKMIVTGEWETANYPKITRELHDCHTVAQAFIVSEQEWALRIRVKMYHDATPFITVEPFKPVNLILDKGIITETYKTSIVYTDFTILSSYHRQWITKQKDSLTQVILECLNLERAYYANNDTGEKLRGYLMASLKASPIKE